MPRTTKLRGRALRKRVQQVLLSPTSDQALEALRGVSIRQLINPLFSFLLHRDQGIKWAAVAAMGRFVSSLAEEDMESGRVVVRRLMWNLNDESGGIGWGSPEAMGEILASHEGLAREYAAILISYARKDGNFQENEILQRGVLWGIGRLASAFPDLTREASPHIIPFLNSPDASVRAHAAWVSGILGDEDARTGLEVLRGDGERIEIYTQGDLRTMRVGDLARAALKGLGKGPHHRVTECTERES